MDQQGLMPDDPSPICKMRHDTAVKATGRAQVQILDAGQSLAVPFSGLAVDEDAETLFERQIVKGEGG